MTLIINNHDVEQVLTMEATIAALERSYKDLAIGEAVCRPRIDIRIPTPDPKKNYQFGTMEGGSTAGYFAIRMKSDIIWEDNYNGVVTQEKYCMQPGTFCGIILLTSIANGEPLALINDGVLQHMRVGADGGIGVKYMANPDAEVVGMLGSGGMSRTHMMAFNAVRNIKKLQVFSPTKANREKFAEEMRHRYNIEVKVCDKPEDVYKGAHILAALTDSAVSVTDGSLLEKVRISASSAVAANRTGKRWTASMLISALVTALRRQVTLSSKLTPNTSAMSPVRTSPSTATAAARAARTASPSPRSGSPSPT
jgi:ornithine cyclodeaminase/alanine dehydrogenase-like protein (mu-crystallin family)